jgi:hypothetical protein
MDRLVCSDLYERQALGQDAVEESCRAAGFGPESICSGILNGARHGTVSEPELVELEVVG